MKDCYPTRWFSRIWKSREFFATEIEKCMTHAARLVGHSDCLSLTETTLNKCCRIASVGVWVKFLLCSSFSTLNYSHLALVCSGCLRWNLSSCLGWNQIISSTYCSGAHGIMLQVFVIPITTIVFSVGPGNSYSFGLFFCWLRFLPTILLSASSPGHHSIKQRHSSLISCQS